MNIYKGTERRSAERLKQDRDQFYVVSVLEIVIFTVGLLWFLP